MLSPELLKIASGTHTVLITGRTGTGKSHLAREIHNHSPRRSERFVAINLATLSENLIESELFGHERGAFSGADSKRIGKMEIANGGTVFLDEIGELSLRLQMKLLEALNSKTISPVGSNREVALNIRILTATNKDLRKMVNEGAFREDLYFRINTFQVHLPDLVSCPEKIRQLAPRFLREIAQTQGRVYVGMSEDYLRELENYPWPGNVRELKNALEFSLVMSGNGNLTLDCLPPYIKNSRSQVKGPYTDLLPGLPIDYRDAKSQFEKLYLEEILRRFSGKINTTAKRTGLSKVTLIDKIRRYEIDVASIKYQAHKSIELQEHV